MDISQIIELILSLLENCEKKTGREATKGRMKNFGKGDGEFAVRLHLRSRGLKRDEINEAVAQLKVAAATASDDDCENLLNAAGGAS